jgi:thiosulfate/3-mercaptopyruvate sulfurtransferase
MKTSRLLRYGIIGILLFLGVCWSLGEAAKQQKQAGYPNSRFLASAGWLEEHLDDEALVVVDVRTDEYFNDEMIPGSIRLPWRSFRYNNTSRGLGSVFVGTEEAQQVLGAAGIMPDDTVVLYDSVERDGGATSSYVFWVLDLLGHENKKVLNGGLDAWKRRGGKTIPEPAEREPVAYQAESENVNLRKWGTGQFIYERLGDPHYQVIDVRSRAEYLGDKGNTDLHGEPLKLGHIPGAFNIEYKKAWVNPETKLIKPYSELRNLYRGIDSSKATIVYCHSGRRSSFGYFVLRLMGFSDPIEYEASWNEWGSYRNYFPVEMRENEPASDLLPGGDAAGEQAGRRPAPERPQREKSGKQASAGYVSCGG